MSLNLSARGSLDLAYKNLKVKQIELINQGIGNNPVISSDAAGNLCQFNGSIETTNDVYIKSGTAYGSRFDHSNTGARVWTLPNSNRILASKEELEAYEGVGVGNILLFASNLIDVTPINTIELSASEGIYANVDNTNFEITFQLDIPTNKNGKKLYINKIYTGVLNANGTNKIDASAIHGIDSDGLATSLSTNAADTSGSTIRTEDESVAPLDCSSYKSAIYSIFGVVANAGILRFANPIFEVFYA